MKQKIFCIICLLLVCNLAYSQKEYAKVIPNDIVVIDSIKSLCSLSNKYRMVVYQPGGYQELCISSIVLIINNNQVDCWVVLYDNNNTDNDPSYSYIVKYVGKLKDIFMFSYPFYLNTGIINNEFEEQEGDFPTPSRIDDAIFYFDSNISFFFNDDTGIISQRSGGYKYRREWLKIIKDDLKPIFKEYCAKKWPFYKDRFED